MAGAGGHPDRHRAIAPQEGRSLRDTFRVVARLRKPHGQQGEVAVVPLVDDPGAVFTPRARVYVLDPERRVVAGPLIVTRRRAYHREWLLRFQGVTARTAVDGWREHLVGVEVPGDGHADD